MSNDERRIGWKLKIGNVRLHGIELSILIFVLTFLFCWLVSLVLGLPLEHVLLVSLIWDTTRCHIKIRELKYHLSQMRKAKQ